MPTLVRQNGFQVMIHTDDHRPAHVHCYRDGRLVAVRLSDLSVVKLRRASRRDISDALQIVAEHHDRLAQAWREIHGEE